MGDKVGRNEGGIDGEDDTREGNVVGTREGVSDGDDNKVGFALGLKEGIMDGAKVGDLSIQINH